MSRRGKLSLAKLLRDIVKAGRGQVPRRGRGLHGGVVEKTTAVTKAANYLAELKLGGNGKEWAANPALDRLVGDLRLEAGNFRLGATARMKATERLLRVEGLGTPTIYSEPIDKLLESLTPTSDRTMTVAAGESLDQMLARIRNGASNDS